MTQKMGRPKVQTLPLKRVQVRTDRMDEIKQVEPLKRGRLFHLALNVGFDNALDVLAECNRLGDEEPTSKGE